MNRQVDICLKIWPCIPYKVLNLCKNVNYILQISGKTYVRNLFVYIRSFTSLDWELKCSRLSARQSNH